MPVTAKKSDLWNAIRHNCLECSGNSRKEVALCTLPDCHLYPYRFGRAPQAKDPVYHPDTHTYTGKLKYNPDT